MLVERIPAEIAPMHPRATALIWSIAGSRWWQAVVLHVPDSI